MSASRTRLARLSVTVAFYFSLATLLGLVRDFFVVRNLGYGAASDHFYLYTAVPLAYFGIAGQATYLPLAVHHRVIARRMLRLVACLAVAAATSITVYDASPGTPYSAISLIVTIVCITALAPRFEAAAERDTLQRAALVTVVANLAFVALLPALPRDVAAYTATYSFGLPLGMIIVLPRYTCSRMRQSAASNYPPVATYTCVSAGLQLYPLLERFCAVSIGAGVATSLALGNKIASLPAGVFGYAIGTAVFGGIVVGRPHRPLARLADLPGGLRTVFILLFAASAGVSLVSYAALPVLFQILHISSARASTYRVFIALVVAVSPWASLQSILNQELLARGKYAIYLAAGAAFLAVFLIMGVAATVAHIGILLATTPLAACVTQLVTTLTIQRAQPRMAFGAT